MAAMDSIGQQPRECVWLEVGHTYEPTRGAPRWRVWVRGDAGADTSALVRKVVFNLRPENRFPYPVRMFDEPPYQVEKSGTPPTEVIIFIYLNSTKSEYLRLKYGPLCCDARRSSAGSKRVNCGPRGPPQQPPPTQAKHVEPQKSGDFKFVEPIDPRLWKTMKRSDLKSEAKGSSESSKVEENGQYEFVEPIDPRSWETLRMPDPKYKAKRSSKGGIEPYPGATRRNVPLLERPLCRPCSAQGRRRQPDEPLSLPPLPELPLMPLPELPAALRRALEAAPAQRDYALQ